MTFWGIELKPGKPYIHQYDSERGRLHISQATLGTDSSTKKCIVQCDVGDKKPIYLCSLLPERLETSALNLEFKEEDEVTFSVIGPHSVHLSGFFYNEDEDQDNLEDDCGCNHFEEDIMGTDSEDEDDDFTDDGLTMNSSSPVPYSGVRIEEIVDDVNPNKENDVSKRAKKKSQSCKNSDRQIIIKTGSVAPVLEEDEDGFPISVCKSRAEYSNSKSKTEETKDDQEEGGAHKKKTKVNATIISKRKIDAVGQDEEHASLQEPRGSSIPTLNVFPDTEAKHEKLIKREEQCLGTALANFNVMEQFPVAEMENDQKPTIENKFCSPKLNPFTDSGKPFSIEDGERKQEQREREQKQEDAAKANAEQKIKDKSGAQVEKEEKAEVKPLQVKSFPNGLVIEELSIRNPNGKIASSGKKVSVHYIGKLKKNGKIFDSNIGRTPFPFRLGAGQVIKGWDVGVNGMRVGEKRRLTIPPAMGYGAKGAGEDIPPNS